MGRLKYLGRANVKFIKSSTSKVIRIDEGGLTGHAVLIKIHEVVRPLVVENDVVRTCIYDNGHTEIGWLPDGENWMLWFFYDNHGKIIDWYFDVTRENAVDVDGNPYCDDLYLDIALLPDGQILVLDEDELRAALEAGSITADEFAMAYRVKDELVSTISVDKMEAFSARLLSLFDN